jgi:hypothetical protein
MLHDQLMNDDSNDSSLSLSNRLRIKLQNCQDVTENLREWILRIRKIDRTQWSDLIRANKFVEFVASTKRVMTKSHLTKFELSIHQKRRLDDLLQKITSRKRFNAANVKELTKENAKLRLEMIRFEIESIDLISSFDLKSNQIDFQEIKSLSFRFDLIFIDSKSFEIEIFHKKKKCY